MTLDRAEVSLALYPTLLTAYAHDPETAARRAVQHADQLLLALTPPVAGPCPGEDARDDAEARKRIAAPVAPKSEAAKYEPRVGDVVRYDDTNAGDEMIVSRIEGGITYWRYLRVRGGADISSFQPSALRFIRPATPAERAAAGLPSPEATRPTHVRITKSASPSRFKDGDVLRVVGWLGDTPSVDIDCHMGGPYVLYDSKWEPADAPKAPAPVEPAKPGTVENMAAHLAWCAWCGTDGRSELPYDAFRAGYLAALAARGAP